MSVRRDEWLIEPLAPDVALALERLERAPDVARIAVLPDVHLASEVCIGTVVATRRSYYPAAVGSDIGCGMAARAYDGDASALDDPRVAARILRAFTDRIPILRHPSGGLPLPGDLGRRPFSHSVLDNAMRRMGSLQLGTLGRGNHFVELQRDESGGLWTMVHSGSRSMGQVIRNHHERKAQRVSGGLHAIDGYSFAGEAYQNDLDIALDYARANRAALLDQVDLALHEVLGCEPVTGSDIECHHNFVREEDHGEPLLVHRKGAISAREGELGILPGSMGTFSCHVIGKGFDPSMCSSSHGAGRKLARGLARRRIRLADLDRQMTGVWFDQRLAPKLLDEAPGAYKDLGAVLRAQKELTREVRRLSPLLAFKGG